MSLFSRKFRCLVGLTVLLVLPWPLAAQPFPEGDADELGFSAERLAVMDARLQRYVDEGQVAGSVALVLRDGKVLYSRARGQRNLEEGLPMVEDTLFRIASQSKAIVSTAIMMLHERGELIISDPLSKYLPEWADVQVAVATTGDAYELVPAERPITLRHLLTHNSGIGYGLGGVGNDAWLEAGISGWYFSGRDEPIRETVRRMADLPLQAQPGAEWIYGYNIDILGAVVEVVSGQSLADFLKEEIFAPLGMTDTFFYVPQAEAERLAVVYQPGEGGLEAVPAGDGMQAQGSFVSGPRRSYSGGAGLVSTATDYARFLQMTLNGGELEGVRLLSPNTVALMTVDHLNGVPFRPGSGMGLGFSVVTDVGARGTSGSLGEYGWGGAYHSTYWVDPRENLVVVYLTQIIGVTNLNDFDTLRATLYGALVESRQ